jgi:hypothetical protein
VNDDLCIFDENSNKTESRLLDEEASKMSYLARFFYMMSSHNPPFHQEITAYWNHGTSKPVQSHSAAKGYQAEVEKKER